jgi:hypothetical protein
MSPAAPLAFRSALTWALISGALALSWEIVWSRLFNFSTESKAEGFGAMLGSYLLGLAAGALLSRKWFESGSGGRPMPQIGSWVAVANIVAFLVAPLSSYLAKAGLEWRWSLGLIALSGALLGVVFPMVCHRALAANSTTGQRMSYLYVANIIGSGFGSLFTGFFLLDHFGIAALSLILLVTGHLWAESMAGWKLPMSVRLVSLAGLASGFLIFDGFYERLHLKKFCPPDFRYANLIETKHGVISVDGSKAVFGNGAYDGVIKTSLLPVDGIMRAYFPSAVLDKVEDVLVIGVSSGSWTRILSCHPQVKKVTAVEISAGYTQLISQYPEVSPILSDPKVEYVIDDGRRWLRRHPDRKFDLVVMNTIYHWREFSSSMLSVEALELVKRSLRPHGAVLWNCTDSARAIRTGMEVFPHTIMVRNLCMASMSPLIPDRERWKRILTDYTMDGKPVLDLGTEEGKVGLEKVLSFVSQEGPNQEKEGWNWLNREHMNAFFGGAKIITDDNLGHEYPGPHR